MAAIFLCMLLHAGDKTLCVSDFLHITSIKTMPDKQSHNISTHMKASAHKANHFGGWRVRILICNTCRQLANGFSVAKLSDASRAPFFPAHRRNYANDRKKCVRF